MTTFTAFADEMWLATGPEAEIVATIRALGEKPAATILVFNDQTGRQTDLDLRGHRTPPAERRGRGRPSLGVTAREVTLLPRHWDWLANQPEGASAALRKLVDAARMKESGDARTGMNAAYEFMKVMGGDRPGYEEALRALFAGEGARFRDLIAAWPTAIRDHAVKLARISGEE